MVYLEGGGEVHDDLGSVGRTPFLHAAKEGHEDIVRARAIAQRTPT